MNDQYMNDQYINNQYQEITQDLIRMVEHNPELKTLLKKSILQAKRRNPDPDTNPVTDLESYYSFLDFCYRCMPWEITSTERNRTLFQKIDQGMGLLYFVCEQPLEELEGKEYFHNSLVYHEPFRSWFIKFLAGSGQFLSTEASWCDEYYQIALQDPKFHLDDDTFEGPENWKSFNDFFARKLRDPARRPIAFLEDDSVVISPADAVPQGIWRIDDHSRVIAGTIKEQAGITIKTGRLTDVSVLLSGSAYAEAFTNGAMTHTMLDNNDYHRYHVPVSGTIREVMLIPQDDAPGGVITWDAEGKHYFEYYSDTFGWQSIETRGVVIIETDAGGLVAVVPVGMCQVSSVNFEESIVPGARVEKGDPLGYFLFGGSDIVMLFSEDLQFEMTAEKGVHLLMGRPYGLLTT